MNAGPVTTAERLMPAKKPAVKIQVPHFCILAFTGGLHTQREEHHLFAKSIAFVSHTSP